MVLRNRKALVIFSKAPELVRRAPDEPYAGLPWTDLDALYFAMLDDVIETANTIDALDIYILKSGEDFSKEFNARFDQKIQIIEAPESAQGEEAQFAFEMMFAKHYEHVVMLLEPHPMIARHDLMAAFGLLQYDDDSVVLGQRSDGKYFLFGLKANHSELFENENQSEIIVKHQRLLERFCEHEIMVFPMLPRYPLDNGANLERLKNELEDIANGNGFSQRTRSMFKMIDKKYRIRRSR